MEAKRSKWVGALYNDKQHVFVQVDDEEGFPIDAGSDRCYMKYKNTEDVKTYTPRFENIRLKKPPRPKKPDVFVTEIELKEVHDVLKTLPKNSIVCYPVGRCTALGSGGCGAAVVCKQGKHIRQRQVDLGIGHVKAANLASIRLALHMALDQFPKTCLVCETVKEPGLAAKECLICECSWPAHRVDVICIEHDAYSIKTARGRETPQLNHQAMVDSIVSMLAGDLAADEIHFHLCYVAPDRKKPAAWKRACQLAKQSAELALRSVPSSVPKAQPAKARQSNKKRPKEKSKDDATKPAGKRRRKAD